MNLTYLLGTYLRVTKRTSNVETILESMKKENRGEERRQRRHSSQSSYFCFFFREGTIKYIRGRAGDGAISEGGGGGDGSVFFFVFTFLFLLASNYYGG